MNIFCLYIPTIINKSNTMAKMRPQSGIYTVKKKSHMPAKIILMAYLPIYPTFLPTYLSNYLSIYLPTYLSTYPPVYLPTCLPTHLSTYLSVYLPTCLPTCLTSLPDTRPFVFHKTIAKASLLWLVSPDDLA